MLVKQEINEKKKYLINRLKGNLDDEEKEKLKITLAGLIELELQNDGLKNIKLYNLIGKLSKNYTFVKTNRELNVIYSGLPRFFPSQLNKEYIDYLLKLANNISKINVNYNNHELNNIEISENDVINISKKFYESLDNEVITEKSNKILNDKSHFGFTNDVSKNMVNNFYGITIPDLIFNKPYISVVKQNNLNEYLTFTHEVMHGIDFYIEPKIFTKIFWGFIEIPTYTIEYLFLDYLEENGFNIEDIKKLRNIYSNYLSNLSNEILNRKDELQIKNNDAYFIPNDLLKYMLELESHIISKSFYEQIKLSKKEGLDNLVKYMKNPLSKDKVPDFSYIGFDNNHLLKISEDMR